VDSLSIRVDSLEEKIGENHPVEGMLSQISTWVGDANNGISKLFTHEVHTDVVCVKKSDGSEVCLTGDELSRLLAGAGEVDTSDSGSAIPNQIDPPLSDEHASSAGQAPIDVEVTNADTNASDVPTPDLPAETSASVSPATESP
jgi:hypothetical protein